MGLGRSADLIPDYDSWYEFLAQPFLGPFVSHVGAGCAVTFDAMDHPLFGQQRRDHPRSLR